MTFEQYYRLFKVHSIPVIGDKRIGDVDPDDIQYIVDRMAARRSYDRDTMKGVLKATKSFFEWLRKVCKSIREAKPKGSVRHDLSKARSGKDCGQPFPDLFDGSARC